MPDARAALQALAAAARQNDRILRLSFPAKDGPENVLLLANKLEAHESLGHDFEYQVEVLSDSADIDLNEFMGRNVSVEAVFDAEHRRFFNGYVDHAAYLKTNAGVAFYSLTLRPWAYFLRLGENIRRFNDKTVQEQIAKLFGECPFADWRTCRLGNDPAITDAYQHQESNANYVHRRIESRGWATYYDHRADGHTLVIDGDTPLCDPIDGSGELHWVGTSGVRKIGLDEFGASRRAATALVSGSSFDFKSPAPRHANAPTVAKQGKVPSMEAYRYAGAYGFKDEAGGKALVRRRIEAIEVEAASFSGKGNDPRVQPGRSFRLAGAQGGEYLILAATHRASNNYEMGDQGKADYSNELTCCPKTMPWRPQPGHNSYQPKVHGVQTATVVGPKGEEIYTDAHGRVKVQFHWDREGGYDENSSAWVRVATSWAGKQFGMVSLPRIGQEVIVSFLDGDPDRPIITGAVYNADNMPPWTLPDAKTQSGLLSRSTKGGGYDNANAIRFEDKRGSEELWIHAEKDQRIEVEDSESHKVGVDRRKEIGRDESTEVKHDRTEKVGNDERIDIGVNRSETVGNNEDIRIGADRKKTVGSSETDRIGKNWSVNVGKMKTETIGMVSMQNVGMGRMDNVGLGYSLNVGGLMNTIVGMSRTEFVGQTSSTTAGKRIELKVGPSSITITDKKIVVISDEVQIVGRKKVEVIGDDVDVNPGGSASAPAPNAATPPASAAGAPLASAAAAAPGGPVTTDLGPQVDALAAKSPSLQHDVQQLKDHDWTIQYGAPGSGSNTQRADRLITLDGNLQSNPTQATQVLSHEVGHATYPYVADYSSKSAYVNGTLADEGAATMNNIRVQREILANGGPNIGLAGNSANHAIYNQAYDQFLATGNAAAARQTIATQFGIGEITSDTHLPYATHYGNWYDSTHPPGH